MKLLAIDPGFERLGIAVLEKEKGGKEQLLYSDCFKTPSKMPFHERLCMIGQEVARVVAEFSPELLAIETLYITNNQKTAMDVAEARGVVLYECSKAGMSLSELTPQQIKIAVTGYGRSDKDQVHAMVGKIIPLGNKTRIDDEVDAIAIGITAFAHMHI